ncbi:MAG: N-6 DNA methylase [Candidatus Buchananbacteria bacterium]|nr:N-6 DNA methylase [Candidatus Buchananbacteria bacterium]
MDKKKIILNTPQVELEQTKLKKKLQELVNKFKAEDGWSKSEEHIQTSFTVELLKILGWDSSNWIINTGQEVKTGKKPDVIIKSDTGAKLLVIESKEASNKDKLDGSYGNKKFTDQLFNYCHGEGLSWGVLTNFIEWRLYSVHHGRLYKERKYAFHELLWNNAEQKYYIDLLSEDGVNFLMQLSKSELTRKNGIIDSDPIYYPEQLDLEQDKIKKDFFNKIKDWRASLKKFIAKNYANYEVDKIDLMAQKIIDRMIFIDLCHDKKILSSNYLGSVLESKQLKYEELKNVFSSMDEKFNTELFAHNDADELKISDDIIVKIIKELDEIDFSKLSVHIIGEVYENYLGELLRSNARKEDTIKQKQKSKRKSQGIYYTPAYIVDYIVKNTVGELLKKCKTVEDIEKVKVLDPACGSGSFLIRAFDEFHNAYLEKQKEGGLFGFNIRKKILQKNLFGVDLDPKAIEITKLNLMIKALEGVNPNELKGKHLLPNLNLNIRCGNSLVGGEKLKEKEQNLNLFDDYETEISKLTEFKEKFYKAEFNDDKKQLLDEINKFEALINGKLNEGLKQYFKNLDKIKPFNYSVAFCEIFKTSGFDAVIGNPPYGAELNQDEKNFYTENYNIGSTDTAILFIKNSYDLIKDNSRFSFIVPKAFSFASNYKKIRNFVWDNIIQIIDCRKVWKEVKLEQLVFVIDKNKKSTKYLSANFKNRQLNILGEINKKDAKEFGFFLNSVTPEEVEIAKNIKDNSIMLNDIAINRRGAILQKHVTDKGDLKVLGGAQIQKFGVSGIKGQIDKNKINSDQAYIKPNSVLAQNIVAHIENPSDHIKIIACVPDKNDFIILDTINQITLQKEYFPYFVWAILNSNLLNWYAYRFIFGKAIRTMHFDNAVTARLPIPKATKERQEGIIKKAKELIKLNKTSESHDKNADKIRAIDYEIEKDLCKLYGLRLEDINIIEKVKI